jgi:hypothetical protein
MARVKQARHAASGPAKVTLAPTSPRSFRVGQDVICTKVYSAADGSCLVSWTRGQVICAAGDGYVTVALADRRRATTFRRDRDGAWIGPHASWALHPLDTQTIDG